MARFYAAAAGTLAVCLLALAVALPQNGSDPTKRDARGSALSNIKSPLAFEPNAGRFGGGYDYVVRGDGSTLALSATSSTLAVGAGHALQTKIRGADRTATAKPERKLPGVVNWYLGKRANRKTGVPTYAGVTYRGVYPGIDLTYHGRQGQLEYDFRLAPHARADQIDLQLSGTESVRIAPNGDLIAQVGGRTVRQLRPVAFQGPRRISASFVLRGDRVSFKVGDYDRTRPLVIDPVLAFSDYVGGSGYESGNSVATDANGNVFIGGSSSSPSIPGTSGSRTAGGFVLKLDPNGVRQWVTYIGGYSVSGVATDGSGNVAVVGGTDGTLVAKNAAQPTFGGGSPSQDGFVAKLDPNGATLWATYLGGNVSDYGVAVASDRSGAVYALAGTNAPGLATGSAFQTLVNGSGSAGGPTDALVAKYSASGAKQFITYIGGSSNDDGKAIALDPSCNSSCDIYIAGNTTSNNFPTGGSGVADSTYNSGTDGFLFKLAPNGGTRSWATYHATNGGTGYDSATGVAVNPKSGNVSIVGSYGTSSLGTQATLNGYRKADGFYAGDPDHQMTWGGTGDDDPTGLAFDSAGNAYVVGATSGSFPVQNAVQTNFGGGFQDAFATKIRANTVNPVWSTYLGGSDWEDGYGVATDGTGGAYFVGDTYSTDYPSAGKTQDLNGTTDGFISRIQVKSPTIGDGPTGTVRNGSPAFTYSDTEPGGTFACKLDPVESSYSACPSTGKSYSGLADGSYTFSVAAVDIGGTRGRAASRSFEVNTKPIASFTLAPSFVLAGRTVVMDGSGSDPGASTITKYEWDLDGDGSFERDTGTNPKTDKVFDTPGQIPISLRITTAAGLTSTATQTLTVSTQTGPSQFGVTINNGAQYTRTPNVTVTANFPAPTTSLLFSNDGGFLNPQSFPAAKTIKWKLDSSGPERLPKIVYVRFLIGSIVSETHIDDIILDETPPKVDSASVTPAAPAASSARVIASAAKRKLRKWKLKVKATDSNSGVSKLQATSNKRKPGKAVKYKRKLVVKSATKPRWIRARDRAGNWSRWKKAR